MKGIEGGIPVVYSTEKPGNVKLLPLSEDKVEEADQFATLPTFRSRILPVLGTIPALFGCAMASYVITELAEWDVEPLAIKNRTSTYEKILVGFRIIFGTYTRNLLTHLSVILKCTSEKMSKHFVFQYIVSNYSYIGK
jgi:hypothetical protein